MNFEYFIEKAMQSQADAYIQNGRYCYADVLLADTESNDGEITVGGAKVITNLPPDEHGRTSVAVTTAMTGVDGVAYGFNTGILTKTEVIDNTKWMECLPMTPYIPCTLKDAVSLIHELNVTIAKRVTLFLPMNGAAIEPSFYFATEGNKFYRVGVYSRQVFDVDETLQKAVLSVIHNQTK